MIARSDWQWFGHAGHGASECRFHLCTQVGDVIVSTVGDYRPRRDESRVSVGHLRDFETMVFKVDGEPCREEGCDCGLPARDFSEIDFAGYMTAGEAAKGHMAMCERWAAK